MSTTTRRLKPRIYLQVQDETKMILYYSVLSQNSNITQEGSIEGPEETAEGDLVYRIYFKESGEGPSESGGTIPDIPATLEGPDKKITLIAIKLSEGVTPANQDGTASTHSRDGDDKD